MALPPFVQQNNSSGGPQVGRYASALLHQRPALPSIPGQPGAQPSVGPSIPGQPGAQQIFQGGGAQPSVGPSNGQQPGMQQIPQGPGAQPSVGPSIPSSPGPQPPSVPSSPGQPGAAPWAAQATQPQGGLLSALQQEPLQSTPVRKRGVSEDTGVQGNDMASFLAVMRMMLGNNPTNKYKTGTSR